LLLSLFFLRPVWKKISKEAKDLLSKMLKVDPMQRFSASECLLHPWVTGQCHRAEHLTHLEDAQRNMKARLERRARRAAQQAAQAAQQQAQIANNIVAAQGGTGVASPPSSAVPGSKQPSGSNLTIPSQQPARTDASKQ
jgi:serine/threonine protein kinase